MFPIRRQSEARLWALVGELLVELLKIMNLKYLNSPGTAII